MSIAPKQNNVANTERLDLFSASLGERLNPDSYKFTISGIPNSLSPSETGVESGFESFAQDISWFAWKIDAP